MMCHPERSEGSAVYDPPEEAPPAACVYIASCAFAARFAVTIAPKIEDPVIPTEGPRLARRGTRCLHSAQDCGPLASIVNPALSPRVVFISTGFFREREPDEPTHPPSWNRNSPSPSPVGAAEVSPVRKGRERKMHFVEISFRAAFSREPS